MSKLDETSERTIYCVVSTLPVVADCNWLDLPLE